MANDVVTPPEAPRPERAKGESTVAEPPPLQPSPEGPASVVQINKLEASRPQPLLVAHYTPSGPVEEHVHQQEAAERNSLIDRQVAAFKARLRDQKGKARGAASKATERDGSREI